MALQAEANSFLGRDSERSPRCPNPKPPRCDTKPLGLRPSKPKKLKERPRMIPKTLSSWDEQAEKSWASASGPRCTAVVGICNSIANIQRSVNSFVRNRVTNSPMLVTPELLQVSNAPTPPLTAKVNEMFATRKKKTKKKCTPLTAAALRRRRLYPRPALDPSPPRTARATRPGLRPPRTQRHQRDQPAVDVGPTVVPSR